MGLVDKNGTIITPVGGVASAALPAAVDAGQPVRAYFDQNGRLHVVLDGESVVVNVGEVQIEGSSDGGTTWYPVKVSAAGVQTHAIDQTTPGTTNGVVERTMGELAPLIGFGNYAAAQTDTALIADPGSGVAIYVTDIVVTNDSTAAITVFLESDTASAKTAITPTYKIPASGGMALHFRTPIKGTVHKNLGVTTTGVSNFTVEAHGYSAA